MRRSSRAENHGCALAPAHTSSGALGRALSPRPVLATPLSIRSRSPPPALARPLTALPLTTGALPPRSASAHTRAPRRGRQHALIRGAAPSSPLTSLDFLCLERCEAQASGRARRPAAGAAASSRLCIEAGGLQGHTEGDLTKRARRRSRPERAAVRRLCGGDSSRDRNTRRERERGQRQREGARAPRLVSVLFFCFPCVALTF